MKAQYKINIENLEHFKSGINETNKRILELSKRMNITLQSISYEVGGIEKIVDDTGSKQSLQHVTISGIETLIGSWQFFPPVNGVVKLTLCN